MNIISNNYGLGHDDLFIPDRGRIHTDNSIEMKYYDRPDNLHSTRWRFRLPATWAANMAAA